MNDKSYEQEYQNTLKKIEKENKQKQKLLEEQLIKKRNTKIIIIILILSLYLIIRLPVTLTKKTYIDEYIDKNNIAEPIQEDLDPVESFEIEKGNTKIYITKISKYSMSGKIEGTWTYLPTSMHNKLFIKDINIVYGKLADPKYEKQIRFISTPNRFAYYSYRNPNLLEEYGGADYINHSFTNNHLLPSNNKIKRKIYKLKKGDYVKIDGYLIEWSYVTSRGEYSGTSSTTRDDNGDGACESIYVTDVNWYK